MKVWINGKLFSEKHAKVPVFDRGFLYGDGVFEIGAFGVVGDDCLEDSPKVTLGVPVQPQAIEIASNLGDVEPLVWHH